MCNDVLKMKTRYMTENMVAYTVSSSRVAGPSETEIYCIQQQLGLCHWPHGRKAITNQPQRPTKFDHFQTSETRYSSG